MSPGLSLFKFSTGVHPGGPLGNIGGMKQFLGEMFEYDRDMRKNTMKNFTTKLSQEKNIM